MKESRREFGWNFLGDQRERVVKAVIFSAALLLHLEQQVGMLIKNKNEKHGTDSRRDCIKTQN